MIYVIAGNYQEYEYWLHKNGIGYKRATYVYGPRILRGVRNHNFVLYGTYYEREDIDEILVILEVCSNA